MSLTDICITQQKHFCFSWKPFSLSENMLQEFLTAVCATKKIYSKQGFRYFLVCYINSVDQSGNMLFIRHLDQVYLSQGINSDLPCTSSV